MNFYSYIKKKIEDGTVKNMYRAGVCTYKVTRYVDIYEKYLEYKNSGDPISNSVMSTSIDFNISERQVWKIIKFMDDDLFSDTL